MDLKTLLQLTIDRQASDLHIIPDYFPTLRVNGDLLPQKTYPVVTKDLSEALLTVILSEELKARFKENREIDFGYDFMGHRFRVNFYYSRGSVAGSFRLIPAQIRSIDDLGLPAALHKFAPLKQGFILVTGPTGEGKSTTLAAIINEINQTSARHILTVEDPIEFIFPASKSIVSQREIGQDTHRWDLSLRSALREDPDVVLVGEMRDQETIAAALTVAETGHLVFSTLHTNSASQTIDRIIDVFPPHQQQQVRIQLSLTLKAVLSQRLLPDITRTGRVVAYELLINTSAVSSLIRDGKTNLIDNVIQTSSDAGMIFFEKSLIDLFVAGKISREVAYQYALRPEEIKKLIV